MTQFITGIAFTTVVGTAGGCAIYFLSGGKNWSLFVPIAALISLAVAVVAGVWS